LLLKYSYKIILLPSFGLMALGLFLLTTLTVHSNVFEIVFYTMITGFGMGAIFPVIGTAAQSAVSVEYRGLSTSLSQFFRSLGGAVGVGILGSFMNLDLTKLQGKYLGKNELSTTLLSQILNSDKMEASSLRQLFNHVLNHVFLLAC
ncbi:MFS transporter, partial [Bacillus smithii]|uniref:MFS transporter n=1 Tax=Bacillus smithii TaxID=1479 RepID=UPI0030C96AE1